MPTDVIVLKSGRFEDAYDIKEEVGRGQFAVVHRVVRRLDGAEFAAKVMRKRSKAVIDFSGVSKQAVEQEVRVLLMVEHPNIIRLEEAYEEKHCFILVFELLKGGELFSKMLTRGRFSEAETIYYLREILLALKHLHAKDIVHLDIKPENVMLSDESSVNSVKIIDFGLSRILSAKHITRDMVGTPEFVAPEVINYDVITLATDMWSVGVLTYILLTGYSPFLGRTQQETYERINDARCQLDGPHFAGVSDVARDFVRRLIRRQPKERANVEQCLQHSWLTLPVPDLVMSDINNPPEVVVAQRLEINDSPSSGTSSPALTDRASIVSSRDTSVHASMTALASSTPPPPEETAETGRHQIMEKNPRQDSAVASTPPPTEPPSSEPPIQRQSSRRHHHHHHQQQELPPGEQSESPSSMLAARAARLRPTREPIVLLRPIPEKQSLLISARGNLRSSKPPEADNPTEGPGSAGVTRKASNKRSTLTEQLKKLKPRTRSPVPEYHPSPASSSPSPPQDNVQQPPTKQLSSAPPQPPKKQPEEIVPPPVVATETAQAVAPLKVDTTPESTNQPGETVKSIRNLSLRLPKIRGKKQKEQQSSSPQQISPGSDTIVGADRVFDDIEVPEPSSRQLRIIHGATSLEEMPLEKKPSLPSVVEQSRGNKKSSQHRKFFRLLSASEAGEDRKQGKSLLPPGGEADHPPTKRSNSPKEAIAQQIRDSPAILIHTDEDSSSAFESASSAAFESLDNIAQMQSSQSTSRLAQNNQQLTLTTSSLSQLHLMTAPNSISPGTSSLSVSPGAGQGRAASMTSSSATLSDHSTLGTDSKVATSTSTITTASPSPRKHSGKSKHHGKSDSAAQKAADRRQSADAAESSAMRLLRKLSGKHKSKQPHVNQMSPQPGDGKPENGNSSVIKKQELVMTEPTPPLPSTTSRQEGKITLQEQQRQILNLDSGRFASKGGNFANNANSMSCDLLVEQPLSVKPLFHQQPVTGRRISSTPTAEMIMMASTSGGLVVEAGRPRIPSATILSQQPRTPSPKQTPEQQEPPEQQQQQNPSLIRWLIGKVITTSGKS